MSDREEAKYWVLVPGTDQTWGPYDLSYLQQSAANSQLSPDGVIVNKNGRQWLAAEFPALRNHWPPGAIPSQQPPAAQLLCPYCRRPLNSESATAAGFQCETCGINIPADRALSTGPAAARPTSEQEQTGTAEDPQPEFQFSTANVYQSRGFTVVLPGEDLSGYREAIFQALEKWGETCAWPNMSIIRATAKSGGFWSKIPVPVLCYSIPLNECHLEIYYSVSVFGQVATVNMYKAAYFQSSLLGALLESFLDGNDTPSLVTKIQRKFRHLIDADAFQGANSIGDFAYDAAQSTSQKFSSV